MLISETFPSKFLAVTDLNGKNVRVRMSHVAQEKMNDGQDKPVLYFQKATKGMVLNKTNAKTIADAYGDDTDHWAGEELIIFEIMTEFAGQPKAGLRVRKPTAKDNPAKAAEAPAPQPRSMKDSMDEEIGF